MGERIMSPCGTVGTEGCSGDACDWWNESPHPVLLNYKVITCSYDRNLSQHRQHTIKAYELNTSGKIRNSSKEIRKARIPQFDNKEWVILDLLKDAHKSLISFEEIYWILKFIYECEEIKYSLPHHLGGDMVKQFTNAVLNSNATYKELAEKFQIPARY